jgi:hypothetical protein
MASQDLDEFLLFFWGPYMDPPSAKASGFWFAEQVCELIGVQIQGAPSVVISEIENKIPGIHALQALQICFEVQLIIDVTEFIPQRGVASEALVVLLRSLSTM